MKLDLDRQPKGRSALDISGSLKLEMAGGQIVPTDIGGSLTVQNIESRVLVSGSLQAVGQATCDRCLGEFRLRWDVPVDLMVMRDVATEETEGETLLILQNEGEVDLQESLHEFSVLAYPQAAVCREDCRGLCVQCGVNLNEVACDCADEEIDPRWEALP